MNEITILIKTFKRPVICQRLIDSIRKYYPDIQIIVLDDDDKPTEFKNINKYIKTEFNIGISAGRNRLVENCQTEYCLILDDDCIFLPETNLEVLVADLKERNLDILQPLVIEESTPLTYQGIIKLEGDVIRHVPEDRDGLYDYVLNIFLAKTSILRVNKWDERFKTGEHAQYFKDHKGKMRISVCDKAKIEHKHYFNKEYQSYRDKAYDYIKIGLIKDGFKKRIDAHGNVLEAI